ncbi:MAG: RAMP superfamily CRISPR-associated protein [Nautiliaceae bacterium]
MKLYKYTINPVSPFATPIKGDTLFGSICWAVVYLYGESKLEKFLEDYDKNPFLIVSDGFLKNHLIKPTFPRALLGELEEGKKKEYRKKIWVEVGDILKGDFSKAKKESEVEFRKSLFEVKNSINYKTFTTGEGFAPFGVDSEIYLKEIDIYMLIKDDVIDEVRRAFRLLSKLGYGKDTNLGKGKFEIVDFKEVIMKKSDMYIALSDFVKVEIDGKIYYDVVTKFPKTRGDLKNPFKNPLLMAKVGAGIKLNKKDKLSFIGKAIKNFSNDSKIVHQGYAITFPIGVEK